EVAKGLFARRRRGRGQLGGAGAAVGVDGGDAQRLVDDVVGRARVLAAGVHGQGDHAGGVGVEQRHGEDGGAEGDHGVPGGRAVGAEAVHGDGAGGAVGERGGDIAAVAGRAAGQAGAAR